MQRLVTITLTPVMLLISAVAVAIAAPDAVAEKICVAWSDPILDDAGNVLQAAKCTEWKEVGGSNDPAPGGKKPSPEEKAAARKAVEAAYRTCVARARAAKDSLGERRCSLLLLEPDVADCRSASGGLCAPPVDAQALLQTAMLKLQLTDATPRIGPGPELNRWNMVAVGYPLWLWTDAGDTTLSASTSMMGVTFTMTARRASTTFTMGEQRPDGRSATVQCVKTLQWQRPTTDEQALNPPDSPVCGYRYQTRSATPEHPNGTYTVTATDHWVVGWSAAGGNVAGPRAGQATFDRTASRDLKVGELQAVICGSDHC